MRIPCEIISRAKFLRILCAETSLAESLRIPCAETPLAEFLRIPCAESPIVEFLRIPCAAIFHSVLQGTSFIVHRVPKTTSSVFEDPVCDYSTTRCYVEGLQKIH